MKLCLTILALLLIFQSNSQKLFVKDLLTRNPVEGAIVSYQLKNGYTKILGFTDNTGYLNLDSCVSRMYVSEEFTIKISCISYITNTSYINEFIQDSITLFLKPIATELQEVIVSNSNLQKSLTISPNRKNQGKIYVSASGNDIIGRIFEVDSTIDVYKIEEIIIQALTLKNSCKQGIIIHILNVYENSPTLDKLYEPIVMSSQSIDKKIRIKVDDFLIPSLLVEKKFFIGIEWQSLECNTNKIYKMSLETYTDIKNNFWTYNSKKQSWSKWDGGLSKTDFLTPNISTIIKY